MNKKELLEQKMKNTIRALDTSMLIDTWENLKKSNYGWEEESIVRGFLIDEFENRDIEAAEAWIDSCEDSPRGFF